MMDKKGLAIGVVGLIIGLTIGFFGANYLNRQDNIPAGNMTDPSGVPGGNTQIPGANVQLGDVQVVLDRAKNEPQNYDAQIKAGQMYSRIQRFDQALEFYERAHKIKPDDFDANVQLGNGYFDARKFEKAGEFYSKALKINPRDVGVRTDFGLTFFLREPGDTDRAIIEFRKSLEIDPKHEITLQNLAAALKEKGDDEELQKVLALLKEVNPNNKILEKYK